MPTYTYACPDCGRIKEVIHSISEHDLFSAPVCVDCSGGHRVMKRSWATDRPRTAVVFPSHFNPTVGREVHSQAEFNRLLADGAKQREDRTGIPHSYQPIHPSEAPMAAEAQEWNDRRADGGGKVESLL